MSLKIDSEIKALFISGTDTEIGKTYTCAALLRAAALLGKKTVYFKPIETGVSPGKSIDGGIIQAYSPETLVESFYQFELPAAPYLAARLEKREISLKNIQQAFLRLKKNYQPELILVEGAGGLLVPIKREKTTLDLVKLLEIPVLLVSQNYLGTINHTLLSLEVLKKRKIEIAGFAFAYSNKIKAEPSVKETNAQIIEEFSGVKFLGETEKILELVS